jgi:hypothetical protein
MIVEDIASEIAAEEKSSKAAGDVTFSRFAHLTDRQAPGIPVLRLMV